jgi:subtilisin family serine protease
LSFGGTSGATPKVAGTVALMLEANPSLTHEEIRTILNFAGSSVVNKVPAKVICIFLNAKAAVNAASGQALKWYNNITVGRTDATQH